jgi:hypothetical protein
MSRHYGNPGSLAHVYAKLHANRADHIEQARRAREYQARLAQQEAIERRKGQSFALALDALLLATLVAILVVGFH